VSKVEVAGGGKRAQMKCEKWGERLGWSIQCPHRKLQEGGPDWFLTLVLFMFFCRVKIPVKGRRLVLLFIHVVCAEKK
jgi:hypothetical protein